MTKVSFHFQFDGLWGMATLPQGLVPPEQAAFGQQPQERDRDNWLLHLYGTTVTVPNCRKSSSNANAVRIPSRSMTTRLTQSVKLQSLS
jgi:hypothetical protein